MDCLFLLIDSLPDVTRLFNRTKVSLALFTFRTSSPIPSFAPINFWPESASSLILCFGNSLANRGRGKAMSWQTYVDDHLMCDIDGQRLTAAAIVGHDGSVWAQSDSFPQVSFPSLPPIYTLLIWFAPPFVIVGVDYLHLFVMFGSELSSPGSSFLRGSNLWFPFCCVIGLLGFVILYEENSLRLC